MFRPLVAIAAITLPIASIGAATPMSGSAYVTKAGASDQYEIQSSRLVMGTSNAQLKQFANQMVTDHTKSTADVKAAAARAGVKVAPPKLEPMQAKMIADLRKVSGPARDRLYVTQQKKSHQMALALHKGYSTDGRSAPLKEVASNITPVVQSHIDMLAGM